MKIAHVTATFPPYTGGTGNVCYHNALELVRLGHEVHVFTAQHLHGAAHRAPQDSNDGIFVHHLRPLLRYGNAFFIPSLFKQLSAFDVVHLHLPFYGGAEAVLLCKLLGRSRLVITYHQDVLLSGFAGFVSKMHDRSIGRWLMGIADRVCFTSLDYGYASKYRRLLNKNEARVCAIANGVDVERFSPAKPNSTLAGIYDVGKRKVILFVGALDRAHHFKGVRILLKAMKRLHDENALLVIVGDGEMLPEYEQYADKLRVQQNVHFAGYVDDHMLAEHYRLADVTVLPSTTMGEAFGLVLLESLACGTPVIGSNIPGVRTVVAHGQDGFLVEPGDSKLLAAQLREILQMDESERVAMGNFGRKKILQTYQWQHSGQQLETLYQTILSNHEPVVASLQ